ncbi:MAG TPA: alpha-2-macroglobulin family protein, partial [Longimicrobium sp.]|nr:alpha-2-macroglobulin family protein [Longimicrobium sp.]
MPSIHPLPRPAALLAALAAALLCAHGARAQNADTAASRRPRLIPLLPPSYGPAEVEREETAGLRFRIQEVRSGSAVEQAPAAAGRPLTPAEASLLLARLRPLASKGEPADSFAFPAQSFPPPRAGRVIANAFPPRDAARAPARPAVRTPAALEVIRRAPEGEVNDPAELSITFSQPMVPLSSVSVVAAAAVPARLSPHVEGRWRWLDTRTLRFEPTGALPRASDVTVEIPAGTRSASGAALAGPVRWTFSTNAPRATGSWPQRASAPMRLDPVFVVAFDQRVDAEAVLRTIRVHAGGAGVPLRLATRDEVAADSDAARRTAGLRAGEWVAFRAVRPLPPDVTVRVSVGPGTPSAEGPRVTPAEQYWEFTTRGAFRVTRTADTRRAGEAFALSLSNPVDAAAFRPGMVRAEPAIEGMEAWAAGASLVVSGRTRANTRYVIRLAPELRDTFGQRLGDAPPVTVAVGLPYASIGAPRDVVVLDPLGPRSITVMTLAHSRVRLRVMRVRPEDWFTFYHSPWRPARRLQPPGTPVVDREVALDGTPGEPHPLEVDLSPALAGGAGQALVAVEALDGQTDGERRQAVYVWVQATRIGLAVFTDATGLTAWATSLVDGAPVTGARLELIGPGTANAGAATDARGVASMALPPSSGSHGRLLVARRGADVAVLAPEMVTYWGSGWARASMRPAALWHHFTDRTLYRPGETVHFKGWVRGLGVRDGSPELLPFAIGSGVAWTASDGEGNEIARGTSPVTALGGFDGAFTVPAGANLGDAEIEVKLPYPPAGLTGSSTTIHYHIDEFRRPEYTVTATADEGPHHVGGSAELSARATYFAGGALPGAPVTWEMTAWPGTFAPPGWSEWSFGDGEGGAARTEALSLATDARGRSTVRVDFPAADPPRPYVVNAQATVTDVNRQTWTAYTGVLVHPASVYLGLRTRRPWLARGDSIRLEMVAVDLDGRPVPGRSLEVRAQARTWRQQNGRWSEVTVDSATCTRVSAATPVRCAFPATHAGWYRLAATTRDARGRPTRSATRVWVTGRGALFSAPGARNDADSVDLVPDKESYQVGDTARILVRTRFTPSRGLVTVRRSGLARTQTLLLDGSTGTFSIPITEADVPNTWIGVDLVGANTATGEGGARGVDHASGKVRLNVPPATRTLSVRTLPRDSVLGPDAPASVGVVVRDAAGRPVANAEVALVVVDEAVLALAGYARPNPLAAFYPTRHGDLEEVNLRPLVQVVAPGYPPAAGTLVGRVSDAATGAYLAGATVAVDGTQLTATTDAVGRFRIAGVAPGRYALLVTMNEFTPARLAVTVGDTPPPPVHVALVPTLSATQIRMRGITSLNLNALVTTGAGVETVVAVGTPGVEIGPAGRGSPIRVRANFDPLAVFTPAVRTDAAGRARVPFTLPSSLTRYRVIAVAVHGGTRYGVGEAAITARQPLMVRPSPPRFLNWGDRMELPVVLQNQTGAPLEASVAARADGIELLDAGRRVVIPAHGRVEVRLRAAASRAGQATLQVAASAGGLSDAAELSLPV